MNSLPKWRLTRTALLRLLFAFVLVLVSCYVGRAQPPAPTPSDEEVDTAVTEVLTPPSPATQTALNAINAQDPQTPTELIQAAGILQQLGAYTEAREFLDRVTGQELNAQAMAELHQQAGTVLLVRLANERAFMPEAREFVHRVFAAAKQVSRDPQRLKQLVSKLTDKDAEARRVAMTDLAAAGAYAVPALLDAIRQSPDAISNVHIQVALIRIGSDGEDALIAALGAPEPAVQFVAAQGLGRVGTQRSTTHLVRPYFMGQHGVQRAASESLRQLGSRYPSTINESAELLRRMAVRHLEGAPPFPADYDDTLEMWTWSAERKNIVPNRLTKSEAAAVAAARLARDAYELRPTVENARLLLISRLQVDQLLGGIDEMLPKGVGTAHDFGTTAGAFAVCEALGVCLARGYDAAAIGALELVGDLCHRDAVGSYWTPLTRALQSPQRRVRHAAARAIMKVDPRQAYPGASFMLEALVDLANASAAPAAIVATPRADVRENLTGLLGSFGFSVHQVNEGRACLQEATRASAYDVILLSDSVSHPPVHETLQQLRKDPQSKLTPVILLMRQDRFERSELLASLDDLVVTMPEFADEETLATKLGEVEALVASNWVPPAQRLVQAKNALDWLVHLAQYSKTYPWYDTMRARPVAIQAVTQPALTSSAVQLMGYLGDAPSQRLLVDLASDKGASPESRQRAANAFGEAVLRRGLMLRRNEVYSQYDRYNASETDEQQTQEVLGQLLDIIETQTKPTAIAK